MARTARLLEDLHQRGISYRSIADDLGVDRRTILRWVKSETHPTPQSLTNNYLEDRLKRLPEMEPMTVTTTQKIGPPGYEPVLINS